MSEVSTKPYLLRAIHEWCSDSSFTPYIAVSVDERTQVPADFVRGGEIVLNISFPSKTFQPFMPAKTATAWRSMYPSSPAKRRLGPPLYRQPSSRPVKALPMMLLTKGQQNQKKLHARRWQLCQNLIRQRQMMRIPIRRRPIQMDHRPVATSAAASQH